MEIQMTRFFKLAKILSGVGPDIARSNQKRTSMLRGHLKKIAAPNFIINSWENLEEEFEDYSSQIRKKWNSYIDNFSPEPIRNKEVESFIDFYNERDKNLLPKEARVEEEKLLPEFKRLLIGLMNSKGEERSEEKGLGIFGGISPKWIDGGYHKGPHHHQSRPGRTLSNWQSNNAWDLLGEPGTPVYSLTKGRVTSVRQAASSAPNIFGTHISIQGLDGYPDIFYTHVDSAAVKPGDLVEVGTFLAKITTPPQPPNKNGKPVKSKMPSHVHIGIENASISSLMTSSGNFKKGPDLKDSVRNLV